MAIKRAVCQPKVAGNVFRRDTGAIRIRQQLHDCNQNLLAAFRGTTVLPASRLGFLRHVVFSQEKTPSGQGLKIHAAQTDETPEGETPTGVRFNGLAWQ